MITSLQGRISHKGEDHVTLQIGGVGLEISAPYSTLDRLNGDSAFLFTRLAVREDSLTLYGFGTEAERELFDMFLKISGIGPKLALTILSTLTVESAQTAIRNERPEVFQRVPGIGKKTAEKIVFELRDRFAASLDAVPAIEFVSINADVLDALTSLGYSVVEAQAAIQALPPDAPEDREMRVYLALQTLGR